jgi:hypothetical protein
MQVFRLMNMPDRVIAFDELPEDMVKHFEMCRPDGFPRHWKEWLGKKKKVTVIPPEKDPLTGLVRRFDPIVEEGPFFYLVDWTLGNDEEKWKEISDYVRQNVSKEFRLMDKLEDMAQPLAANKTDGVTLEPEEVVVIPLPKVDAKVEAPKQNEAKTEFAVKCDEGDCKGEFKNKQALRMHKMKRHPKVAIPA